MGLKVLTLSYCALKRKRVKLHSTGEKATVSVEYPLKGMTFFLHFDDGRKEEIHWTQDMQGFVAATGDLDEEEESLVPA